MLVNVGRIIERPREWDGSISMSKIPVSTKRFPEVSGQAAAVVDHSTKLFHLRREQDTSQTQGFLCCFSHSVNMLLHYDFFLLEH